LLPAGQKANTGMRKGTYTVALGIKDGRVAYWVASRSYAFIFSLNSIYD
jgi:hypothetical protein